MKNSLNPMQLSLTGRRWELPKLPENCGGNLLEDMQPLLRALLHRRGVVGVDAVNRYLDPSLQRLDDPGSIAGIDPAVARLVRAIARHERISVYGDYDVDGVCSTAIVVEFLRTVGGVVDYYIPDRRAEGYGLNSQAVATLATQAKVLVTVDCGITASAEIALAQRLGVDVIVVDHHQVPDALPPAVACLNPHRIDCRYPFKDMCAAGVAFMLVVALRRSLRERRMITGRAEPDLRPLLDLVAVATVADMVPIRDTNRVLVAAGLRRIAQAPRPGLEALCRVANLDPTQVTATDLGFRLGPRINARGRMSQANSAVELMLTRDAAQATKLATQLDAANTERRQVERATLEAAIECIEKNGMGDDAALVLYNPHWHPGVLGLVASRLAGRYHRPALVIGEGGKGSGRSVESFNLHAALSQAAHHLIRFGGHPAAAGVTVVPNEVDALRVTLTAIARHILGAPPYNAIVRPDLQVQPHMLNLDTVRAVERLAPFGQGNPQPLFVAHRLPVRRKRLVGESHLKLSLGDGTGMDGIAFGLGELLPELPTCVDAAFYLERNEYQGQVSLQLRIQDLRCAS